MYRSSAGWNAKSRILTNTLCSSGGNDWNWVSVVETDVAIVEGEPEDPSEERVVIGAAVLS